MRMLRLFTLKNSDPQVLWRIGFRSGTIDRAGILPTNIRQETPLGKILRGHLEKDDRK
jgi:hypothetical protein